MEENSLQHQTRVPNDAITKPLHFMEKLSFLKPWYERCSSAQADYFEVTLAARKLRTKRTNRSGIGAHCCKRK